jgi:hypothetical protein
MFKKISSYVTGSGQAKPFFYNISGLTFTLDSLKNGVLRGNKKAPNAYMRTLSGSDPRAKLLPQLNDPRVNIVALDLPEPPENIEQFGTDLDDVF